MLYEICYCCNWQLWCHPWKLKSWLWFMMLVSLWEHVYAQLHDQLHLHIVLLSWRYIIFTWIMDQSTNMEEVFHGDKSAKSLSPSSAAPPQLLLSSSSAPWSLTACWSLGFTAHEFTDYLSPPSSTSFPATAGAAITKQALINQTINTRPAPDSPNWQPPVSMVEHWASGSPGEERQETRLLHKCYASAGLPHVYFLSHAFLHMKEPLTHMIQFKMILVGPCDSAWGFVKLLFENENWTKLIPRLNLESKRVFVWLHLDIPWPHEEVGLRSDRPNHVRPIVTLLNISVKANDCVGRRNNHTQSFQTSEAAAARRLAAVCLSGYSRRLWSEVKTNRKASNTITQHHPDIHEHHLWLLLLLPFCCWFFEATQTTRGCNLHRAIRGQSNLKVDIGDTNVIRIKSYQDTIWIWNTL